MGSPGLPCSADGGVRSWLMLRIALALELVQWVESASLRPVSFLSKYGGDRSYLLENVRVCGRALPHFFATSGSCAWIFFELELIPPREVELTILSSQWQTTTQTPQEQATTLRQMYC